jgi:putative ABC transport system permease protein
MSQPSRIYSLLLKLYPARFREDYSGPLERQFRDDYRDLTTRPQRFWFWLGVVADLGTSIPVELCRELRQDAAYALRVYRRRRLVTLLALSALALAIGAATGVFSVVNAVLLRSLPFHDPARLVELRQFPVTAGSGRQKFLAWQRGAPYLAGAAAYATADLNLLRDGSAQRVHAAAVSANFFQLLGAPPSFGRDFRPEEDAPGAGGVAILSYGFWQQSFGGDPQVLGSTLRLNGAPIEIVGIAPPGVEYPAGAALWTPTVFDLRLIPVYGVVAFQSIGRLAATSPAQARREYLADSAAHGSPWSVGDPNAPDLVSIQDALAGSVRPASLALLAAVTLVLLMACANVAHLLLTRYSERREELAIRATLGAGRGRLVQQLITESLLLTAAASAAGLAVAWWVARLAWRARPAGLSSEIYTVFDWRVLAFALALAWLTGLLFGVVPALLMGRMHPRAGAVRDRSGSGNAVNLTRSVMVALQAALAVTLLAGCFVMGRTFLPHRRRSRLHHRPDGHSYRLAPRHAARRQTGRLLPSGAR